MEGPAQLQCLIAVECSTCDIHVSAILFKQRPGAVYLNVIIKYMASREWKNMLCIFKKLLVNVPRLISTTGWA